MYRKLENPWKSFELAIGSAKIDPLVTLVDEYGGVSHIAIDDHCYVLYNGSVDGPFRMTAHWYPEAVAALQGLPLPT